jgi:hypothetical protein
MEKPPPFSSPEEITSAIDSIPYGDAGWFTFTIRYAGELSDNSPDWKLQQYDVHIRDTWTVLQNIISMRKFHNKFDYAAYEHYTSPGNCLYSNFMSGIWANKESVRILPLLHQRSLTVV